MSLVTSKSKRSLSHDTVTVISVVNLSQDRWPVGQQEGAWKGKPIPKSLLVLSDGSSIGVLDHRIKNLPVRFPEGGLKCLITSESNTYTNSAGVETAGSNVMGAEFDSTLRYIVENAKAVAITADLN